MPRGTKKVLQAYLTPEEYDQVKASAEQAGLSLSTFVKRVCLGTQPRSRFDQEAVLALLKANADLGRLGGLFKMALTEGHCREFAFEFRQALRKIEAGQAQVRACCRAVVDSAKARQKQ